jgi:RimJ/RimL family protein N-acetyltransferase
MKPGSETVKGSSPHLAGPAYRIETDRLCIRCWSPTDAPQLKKAVDPNMDYLRPWLPWITKEPEPIEARIAWLRKSRADFDLDKDFVYGIFDREESEVLGGTGLHTRQGPDAREIGYWIQEKYQKKGFATEVAAALTRVAFEVDRVRRVHIHCSVDNVKSARIPEKLGFQKEAVLRKRIPTSTGELGGLAVWTMIAEEYPGSIPAMAQVAAFDATGNRLI